MARVGFDPTTYNSSTAEYTVGGRFYFDGDGFWYRYIKAQVALAAGDVVTMGTSTTATSLCGVPSNDPAAINTTVQERTLGVAVGTISLNNYGFVLCDGFSAVVKDGAGACTLGLHVTPLTGASALQGNAAPVTLGTNDALVFGYVSVATAAGVCGVWVRC